MHLRHDDFQNKPRMGAFLIESNKIEGLSTNRPHSLAVEQPSGSLGVSSVNMMFLNYLQFCENRSIGVVNVGQMANIPHKYHQNATKRDILLGKLLILMLQSR